jgi:CBS domain containing-hemolysin-like protein
MEISLLQCQQIPNVVFLGVSQGLSTTYLAHAQQFVRILKGKMEETSSSRAFHVFLNSVLGKVLKDQDGGNLLAASNLAAAEGKASSWQSSAPLGVVTPALFVPSDFQRSGYETIYFSFVVALTLGFGDILPKTVAAQFVVNLLTLVGYVGLGGLLTIFSNQLGRRGE